MHRVRFEDFQAGACGRIAVLKQIESWLGVDLAMETTAEVEPPVVMATAPPRPGRWRRNAAELESALKNNRIRGLAAELGYNDEREWT